MEGADKAIYDIKLRSRERREEEQKASFRKHLTATQMEEIKDRRWT